MRMSPPGHDIGIYRSPWLSGQAGSVRDVSNAFLLQMAEVSAGLVGLFLIGVFFYVESGDRRSEHSPDAVDLYFRASTRIVLVLFAIPVGLSLTLVVMEPVWPRVLFVVLSLALVAANIDSAPRVRAVTRTTASTVLVVTEVLGSLAVAVTVTLPWVLGGLHPGREDLAWAILISFATGCLSIYAVVMSAFDITRPRPDPGREVNR
jgi:hypothetical protein